MPRALLLTLSLVLAAPSAAGAASLFVDAAPAPVEPVAVAAPPPDSAPVESAGPAQLCEAAIAKAAATHDVPHRLLRAVSLVESGRTRNGVRAPWPWTVNIEGKGRWFDSRDAALAWVREAQARGARSFDLGCLQVNHFWHGKHFADLETMIAPGPNADYAARFLKALKAETGDWMRAAGYYHSRTPAPFQRYSKLIAAAYDAQTEATLAAAAGPPPPTLVAAAAPAPSPIAVPADSRGGLGVFALFANAPRGASPIGPATPTGSIDRVIDLAALPRAGAAAPAATAPGSLRLDALPRAGALLAPAPAPLF